MHPLGRVMRPTVPAGHDRVHVRSTGSTNRLATTPDDPEALEVVLPLAAEELVVSRQTRHTTVRVSTTTVERKQHVDVPLTHRRIEVEHVSINQVVASIPPTREVDGATIVPVVEEVVVVERRLVLKEGIRIREVIVEYRHTEDVVLRT